MVDFNAITIPTLVPNTAIPVPPPDNRVAPKGSLIYFDPTHPANPRPTGIGAFPNLVETIAAETMGVGQLSQTQISVANSIGVGEGVVERTSKGGLYIASSRTADVTAHVYQLLMSPQMQAWILANKAHMFYISMSMRVTGAGQSGQTPHFARIGQNSSTFAVAVQEGQNVPASRVSGVPVPNRTTSPSPGLMRVSAAGRGQDASRPVDITSLVQWFLSGGPLTAAALHQAADFIVYDFVLEDLTVSGRSFADAEAQFAAKHAQMHGTGGRYFGDTWRDPATIA
ncbi:hypothetical protein C1N74_06390 [Microbacterium sp. SGAir0570]|uniref:hypothetical protein n=1 Tax=Microbacterium sp. SGAir0570 TaxID=2070348 RepID=UPI0010CD567B|nr:hypothetical protein [Microbacterium sp. SGAir0570]QCR40088.1 hypothetical protein C1N74_06390 [Microbacterium sp. SGAir0570]